MVDTNTRKEIMKGNMNATKEIIDKIVCSKIIILLSKREDYQSSIAKKLDLHQSVIQRNLKFLQREKLVTPSNKNNNLNNTKIFFLNSEKLNYEFIEYVSDNFNVTFPEDIKTNIKKNIYLTKLIKKLFEDHRNTNKNPKNWANLKEMFNTLIMQLCYDITPHNMAELTDLAKKNPELNQFIEFTYIIYQKVNIDKKSTLEEFYDEIMPTKVISINEKKS